MRPPPSLLWALEHPRWMLALRVLLALALGAAAGWGLWELDLRDAEQEIAVRTQREADALQSRTLGGRPMGAIVVAGQLDAQIRAAARSDRVLSGLAGEQLRDTLETLARSVEADGALVVNGEGLVVGVWDPGGRGTLGQSLRFQPYVQMARESIESVYAAVGGSGAERALYLAAPIYAEQGNYSAVSGVLVIHLLMGQVDRTLTVAAEQALLISPQGLVFSSKRPDWLFMLEAGAPAEAGAELRRGAQFGPAFVAAPRRLEFEARSQRLRLEGQNLLAAQAGLQWNDVLGDWRVLLMRNAPWRPWHYGGLALAVALLAGALLGAVWHALRAALARRQAVAEQAATAERLAAEAQWQARVTALASRLQLTRDAATLASDFLTGLCELLAVHQAALYGAGTALRLLASCGGARPPATLELGQGLVGECAQARQALVLEQPPSGFWTVRSGLAEGQPAALLVLPVLRGDSLVAVLELAGLQRGLLDQRATLDALLPVLALNLEAALAQPGETHAR